MRAIAVITTKTVEVTDAEFEIIHSLYHMTQHHKLKAIKFIKDQYDISLKEAMDICNIIGESIL